MGETTQTRTKQGLVRRLDETEVRKGKTRKGLVQRILLPVRAVGTHSKEVRVDGNSVLQLGAVGTCGKVVP